MGAYQFKIIIKGSKPPIWRRVLIPQGITFETLHQMIQTAFCWSDCHLFEFEFRTMGIRVTDDRLEEEFSMPGTVSGSTVIDELVADTKKFTYTYDLGDNWEHTIEVEKILEEDTEPYARVVKYKGDVIPEDCGGIYGYYHLLDILADPKKLEELKAENGIDYLEWAGNQGMGTYDVELVNEKLKALSFSEGRVPESGKLLLEDIFGCYDKESITALAKRHGMSGYSKYKKEELIRATVDYLIRPEVMRRYFLCARDKEIELFEQILEGNGWIPLYEDENIDYLYAGGYVTEAVQQGTYLVADDVKTAYGVMNTEQFQAERSRISRIGDCLCAANSLYAVSPVSAVLDIFNEYASPKLTDGELLEAYETLSAARPVVELVDGRFVDRVLAEQNTYEELYRMQRNIPYYIPSLTELKFMADNGGFLMGKELQKLGEFLTGELGVKDEVIPDILRDVQSAISVGANLQTVIDELGNYGVVFSEQRELEKFSNVIIDVWNNTRMVMNHGYTPHELVRYGFSEAPGQRKNVQKIYPNDPCPCGSGKKYKKCCGKK